MIKFFRRIRQTLLEEGKTTKYFKYAIGEIVLVVIGILIALQVNNWNETRVEQHRIKEYAKALVQDLNSDLEMLNVTQYQAANKYRAIDSLKKYVSNTPIDSLSNAKLYTLTRDVMYKTYKWNRSTFEALKSSGGLRYITNDSLAKKLVDYQTFSQHLDEDFDFDKSNFIKSNEFIAKVLNLNSPYFSALIERDDENTNEFEIDIFTTPEYKNAKANDLKLLSYNPELFGTFINTFSLIQEQYRIRAFSEMPQIMEDAHELIVLLKESYNL